ncbi:MAG TPA: hypothetical protein VF941_11860 [Clostridia bacterium]
MDVIASPIITVVLNLVANILIAKGILDSRSAVSFVQFGNNAIAGLMTFGVGVYSIYKMIELKKHQITTNAKTASLPSVPFTTPQTTIGTTGQSGMTLGTNNKPDITPLNV